MFQITRLKIDHNPFAKGFRENGGGRREKRCVTFHLNWSAVSDRQCHNRPRSLVVIRKQVLEIVYSTFTQACTHTKIHKHVQSCTHTHTHIYIHNMHTLFCMPRISSLMWTCNLRVVSPSSSKRASGVLKLGSKY